MPSSSARDGVTCNDTAAACAAQACSVTELTLGRLGLNGSLPASLSRLRSVHTLYISSNEYLRSSIPSSIGDMSALRYLNLKDNDLSGSIPSSLGGAGQGQLMFLSLRENRLTGALPSSLAALSRLGLLLLDSNLLAGRLPDIFGSMRELEYLSLSYNCLSGAIPSSVGNLALMTNFLFNRNSFTGSLPSSIGACTSIMAFIGTDNLLSGSLPSSLGALVSVISLDLAANCLTGSVPSSLGLLSSMTALRLDRNRLTGPVPPSLGGACALSSIILNSNRLTGAVPSEVFHARLSILTLEDCLLGGSIPDTSGSKDSLKSLSLANNFIEGSIPVSLLAASRLKSLHLSSNLLSGSIPADIGNLTSLVDFAIDRNFITGTIPTSLFRFVRLALMHDNHLSGTLPEIKHSYSAASSIYLNDNLLTGTIPSSFVNLNVLNYLLLYGNQLSGTVPSSLGALGYLVHLQLQNNRLTGSPAIRFSSLLLNTLDLSQNAFTGSVPRELFANTDLVNLALSLNCFSGAVSPDICYENASIKLISMDGLRSGRHCPGNPNILVPRYSGTMEGGIPHCVFALTELTTLNIAGNGFTGPLPAALPNGSFLQNLTLSHNRLTGTLSRALQTWPFRVLDLSYNRLSGPLQHMGELLVTQADIQRHDKSNANSSSGGGVNYTSTVILKQNRLSGRLPTNFRTADKIDVLEGNKFSCAALPANDPSADYYQCASSTLDNSLLAWGVVVPLVALAVLCVNVGIAYRGYLRRHGKDTAAAASAGTSTTATTALTDFLRGYMSFLQKQGRDIRRYLRTTTPSLGLQQRMPQLCMFTMLLHELRHMALAATLFGVLALGTAVVVIKLGDWPSAYPTYQDQYGWLWSAAYLGGTDAAIALVVLWAAAMGCYALAVSAHTRSRHRVSGSGSGSGGGGGGGGGSERNSRLTAASSSRDSAKGEGEEEGEGEGGRQGQVSGDRQRSAALWGLSLLDVFVVFVVNAGYVRVMLAAVSRTQTFLVQLALAGFNVSWNKLVCLGVTGLTQGAGPRLVSGQHALLLTLLLVNSVLAPVFSSIVVDNNCFRSLLFSADEIDSDYSYYSCLDFSVGTDGSVRCSSFGQQAFRLSYEPSYIYNYQCTSSVIANYVPILLLVYLVQTILFPLLFAVLSSVGYAKLPPLLAAQLPGFLWPAETQQQGRRLIPAAELLAGTR
jgi:Leucine-rich repeat (LRR) protein